MNWKSSRQPTRGWNTRVALLNPRAPAVPATLDITLEEYYAAAGAIGLLSAQLQEPDPRWASEWSLNFGATMAAEARRRRQNKTPKR